jgi:UDP-hydrolysing UDP-N-acetyl-D-glucosamine 2-epimerase
MKVCFFTGTRAEYGLLKPLITMLMRDSFFTVQVIVSGTHLSPAYGMTINEIKKDNIPIDRQIEILLSSDSHVGIAKSMGLAISGVAEALEQLKPDVFVILGDRYEALAAASAAVICNIPIAHIHGGEITFGAIDDAMRHAITKLSTIHFTSTHDYRRRVIQMGEDPEKIFCVGALGLDNINQLKLIGKSDLLHCLNIDKELPILLITFHPETKEFGKASSQINSLLQVLRTITDHTMIITGANCDAEGQSINHEFEKFAKENENAYFFLSLGQIRYLSMMAISDAVIGNSSSGIIEAPSFGVPTVNIGNRQSGRIKAASILDCKAEPDEILKTIQVVLTKKFKDDYCTKDNPNGDGFAAERIAKVLKMFEGKVNKSPFFEIRV